MTESANRDGVIYGGLLLSLQETNDFQPFTFPFADPGVQRGNHIRPHSDLTLETFDYWHGGQGYESLSMHVAERGINMDGRMVGHDCDPMLRNVMHRILTINKGVKPEERLPMLEVVTKNVFPQVQAPSFISLIVQSSQPKFILFSRDIPIHVNVFCDEHSIFMVWTNESDLDKRMRQVYGERFAVFRMEPIVNRVVVLQSYYLRKKISRWKYEIKDRLRWLNALEAMVARRAKSDEGEAQ